MGIRAKDIAVMATSVLSLTFAKMTIEAKIRNVITAVPMSGSFTMSMKGIKTRIPGTIRPFRDKPLGGTFTVLKYFDKTSIIAIFENSDG